MTPAPFIPRELIGFRRARRTAPTIAGARRKQKRRPEGRLWHQIALLASADDAEDPQDQQDQDDRADDPKTKHGSLL
jgi:hypothetical protein